MGVWLQFFRRMRPVYLMDVEGVLVERGETVQLLEEGAAHEEEGRFREALACYDAALKVDARLGRAHFNRGNVLQELGALEAALTAYGEALALKPESAAAHYNCGNVLVRLARHIEASESYRTALRYNPDFAEAHLALGITLEAQEQLEEAETCYRKALKCRNDYALAYYHLGNVLAHLEQIEEAANAFLGASELSPDYVGALCSSGLVLKRLGRLKEAADVFKRLVVLYPEMANAHNDLGAIYMDMGRTDLAMQCYRRAIEIDPGIYQLHSNLGVALRATGRPVEAIESLKQALLLAPDFFLAYHNMASALADMGQTDEALNCYRKALEISPDSEVLHHGLGVVLHDLGRLDEAIRSQERSLAINPDYAVAHGSLGNVLLELGRFSEAFTRIDRALELKPDYFEAHDSLLFMHNFLADQPPENSLEDARRYGRAAARKATVRSSWAGAADADRRLRVGFVSGDLRFHPVGFFAESVFKQLSAGSHNFSLYAYSTKVFDDPISNRIRSCCVGWVEISGLSDGQVAERIAADGIDILIDLSGHTAHNRLPVFAWKPAPVQVNWLGYFATTGVKEIDYLIADSWTLPESEERFFTEKIWRLPETRLCFTEPDEDVTVMPLPALGNRYVTFGCFNNLAKMNDRVVALWARILKAVPGSRLFLKARQFMEEPARNGVVERFARHGVDAGQLMFEDYVFRRDYFSAYDRVDIGLDPFPYTGGTTTAESLWMGVPVLTLAGERFLSRQGVGLLMNAGLPDWVARDEEDYFAKAVKHASNLANLALLRSMLRRQVLASPVFDAERFATHFEQALRGMWKTWCAKQSLK